MVNDYPYILSDFSQLIDFSFDEVQSYFKEKIIPFESEYYFLINPNPSLLLPNNKLGLKNKIIDEIINIAFEIKSKHSSSRIKIFTYKKYVKEITEINEDDDTEMDKERICELLIKEAGDSPKSDILTSLSNLYTKIVKPLKNEKKKTKKIMKIIIVNNEMEKYKNIHEKKFDDEKLENILNEFINDNSYFFGVELKYLDDRLLTQQRKGFEKISDYPTGQSDIINENKEENLKIIKSIYSSDDLLKKAEKLSLNLYKKWNEISENEVLNKGIDSLDEILQFYKDVMNSILFMKHKISINNRYKERYVQKINSYVSYENLNNKKNNTISYDDNESFTQEINELKIKMNEINVDNFVKKINDNKRYNNCICWSNISNYVLNQKKLIIQYLDILSNSKTLIELFEKEIIKKSEEIINSNEDNEDEEENDNNSH